jgi:hypothetical protein
VKLVEDCLSKEIREDFEQDMGNLNDEKIQRCLALFARDPMVLDLFRHIYILGWMRASSRALLREALRAMDTDNTSH